MNTGPPPLISTTTTFSAIPQFYNNLRPPTNTGSHHHHSSPQSLITSIIITLIVISSTIIASAAMYLLIRFFRTKFSRSSSNNDVVRSNDVVLGNGNEHVIDIANSNGNSNNGVKLLESLPVFTFSSLTGKLAGGDCAVCLSRFKRSDQLRLLPLCCHAFHVQCIDAWLKANLTCPLCRSTVNPNDTDILKKLGSGENRSNSFRIEIGTISQQRERDPSESDRRSYSLGSYEYVLDDGYEIPVESTHRRAVSDCNSVDKDPVTEPAERNLAAEVGGSGRNWLRDYVERVSVSISSRTASFRGSGRFFTGSSRRSEGIEDFEAIHGRIGVEISEYFRWLSGV